MPLKHGRRRKAGWTRKGRPVRSRVPVGAKLNRIYLSRLLARMSKNKREAQGKIAKLQVEIREIEAVESLSPADQAFLEWAVSPETPQPLSEEDMNRLRRINRQAKTAIKASKPPRLIPPHIKYWVNSFIVNLGRAQIFIGNDNYVDAKNQYLSASLLLMTIEKDVGELPETRAKLEEAIKLADKKEYRAISKGTVAGDILLKELGL